MSKPQVQAMPTVQLDSKPARCPWYSIQHAQKLNALNQAYHSSANLQRAQDMRDQLDQLYTHEGIYVNYRQKFISVKVNRGNPLSMFDLTKQELVWMRQGVRRAVTQQGVIYRIPRA